jgi:hypothetical protein
MVRESPLASGVFLLFPTGSLRRWSLPQSAFRDKLAMWHGPKLRRTESEKILAACFRE